MVPVGSGPQTSKVLTADPPARARSPAAPRYATRPHRVRRLLRSATMVTAPSGYLRDRMEPFCSELLEIPNGVEVSRYEWRHRTQAKPCLLWVRAFHSFYNPVMAVEALAQIVSDFPHARLNMVGPDKGDGSLQECRDTAERLGIAQHWHPSPAGLGGGLLAIAARTPGC